MALHDFNGRIFGRLTVIQRNGSSPDHKPLWLCRCICGAEKTIRAGSLAGGTSSCGCLMREINSKMRLKHGGGRTQEYHVWRQMMKRCYDPNHKNYGRYGARGITVCDRWHDFANFAHDMLPRPTGKELDREDNDGPYCPENCRWTTRSVNCNNKQNNHRIEIGGRTLTMTEWGIEAGIGKSTIKNRINLGWSGRDLLLPVWTKRKEAAA